MSEHKVIFHIDELNKWKLLLKNVSNLLGAVDINKFIIEVLANSEAVKFYKYNQDLELDINTMEKLNSKGIKFVACNNALIANDINKDDLINFIDVVPVGILELINKQSEGYAYIKP
jgi:intracellular sulfur oxidation DsrE/DsrF family protein